MKFLRRLSQFLAFLKSVPWARTTTGWSVLRHLSYSLVVGMILLAILFKYIFPTVTLHGETITVPELEGIHESDLEDLLSSKGLKYKVMDDSSYSHLHPTRSVLRQYPAADSKVKENRKIFVTLNSNTPPMVKFPDLRGSVKNGGLVLRSNGLILGEVEHVPDEYLNIILKCLLNGKEVKEGELVPKGSVIDVQAGDGLGKVDLQAPDLMGLDFESARVSILGSGLVIGNIEYARGAEEIADRASLIVFKQNPSKDKMMRVKDSIGVWLRPNVLIKIDR